MRDDDIQTLTVVDRPDVSEPAWERTRDVLPEYNNHGDVLNRYWSRLTQEQPEFQFHLVDRSGEILARARSVAVRWNGTVDDLPAGIDGAIARGFDEGGADALCALVIAVAPAAQSRGVSRTALEAMIGIADDHGL